MMKPNCMIKTSYKRSSSMLAPELDIETYVKDHEELVRCLTIQTNISYLVHIHLKRMPLRNNGMLNHPAVFGLI
jgi:hypothetical protein